MTWSWRYEDANGTPVTINGVQHANDTFPNQADAESWLGTTWRELASAGAAEAILNEADRVEYRMSLLAPDA